MAKKFPREMARFLPNETVKETGNPEKFWEYLNNLMENCYQQLSQVQEGLGKPSEFKM